eukprot:CAMPEP_0202873084 /NCGR_PEP_ID=MMETSP1391-20130828/22612_1 /ASSEMBLY_ACC=CAM_ASM_000867 /TAXON_ID=1034604 /ORGANISM="Chlamydomonas leiostraca, Strain SAG 11-49" /LENGTH=111 /DNA_ID=CAMNT_0049554251 /DNA_START=493 /DNA_END=828 /DNA_ORIENTATION=-
MTRKSHLVQRMASQHMSTPMVVPLRPRCTLVPPKNTPVHFAPLKDGCRLGSWCVGEPIDVLLALCLCMVLGADIAPPDLVCDVTDVTSSRSCSSSSKESRLALVLGGGVLE